MDVIMDGTVYQVNVKSNSFVEDFEIKDGPNADTSIAGTRIPDILGTYFTHTMAVEPDWSNFDDYFAFYEALTQPVPYHTVTVPHGNGHLTYKARILSGKHNLYKEMQDRTNLYTGFVVKYIPTEPQLIP